MGPNNGQFLVSGLGCHGACLQVAQNWQNGRNKAPALGPKRCHSCAPSTTRGVETSACQSLRAMVALRAKLGPF